MRYTKLIVNYKRDDEVIWSWNISETGLQIMMSVFTIRDERMSNKRKGGNQIIINGS